MNLCEVCRIRECGVVICTQCHDSYLKDPNDGSQAGLIQWAARRSWYFARRKAKGGKGES